MHTHTNKKSDKYFNICEVRDYDEVYTEVRISPVQALPDVLLLLLGDNVLVEELLQLLVALVNSDLLKIFISNPAM